MVKLAWRLVVLAVVASAVTFAAQPAAAQNQVQVAQVDEQPAATGEYPNLSGVRAFSAETNYMSLPGYLRWMVFREQSVWLSVPEAKRIVAEQTGG